MKYVALLRGINVGGRVIKKDDLKACFEKLGFSNVETVIQSGNVLFETDESKGALKEKIESALTKAFSYAAKVIVSDIPSLKKIVETFPLKADSDKHSYVIFLAAPIGQEILDLVAADPKTERFELGDRVIYWQVKQGMSLKSNLAILLAKNKYKEYNTVRNLNTLEKILTKV